MIGVTPKQYLLDQQNRPYFLWDCDITIQQLHEKLMDSDPKIRCYWMGKVMRQAKPEDAIALLTWDTIKQEFSGVIPYLGNKRSFWKWLFSKWTTPNDK